VGGAGRLSLSTWCVTTLTACLGTLAWVLGVLEVLRVLGVWPATFVHTQGSNT